MYFYLKCLVKLAWGHRKRTTYRLEQGNKVIHLHCKFAIREFQLKRSPQLPQKCSLIIPISDKYPSRQSILEVLPLRKGRGQGNNRTPDVSGWATHSLRNPAHYRVGPGRGPIPSSLYLEKI